MFYKMSTVNEQMQKIKDSKIDLEKNMIALTQALEKLNNNIEKVINVERTK
mgnify:CR=1 FL=1